MLRAALSALALAATASAAMVVDLQPHGDHSIRVRVAPEGGAIVDPPAMALLFVPPPLSTATARDGPNSLTNGNLKVVVDPATGFVTATRVTDGKVLLEQTALAFAAPHNSLLDAPLEGTKNGSVSTKAAFKGLAAEKIVGFGEHRTGTIGRKPYSKVFAESQVRESLFRLHFSVWSRSRSRSCCRSQSRSRSRSRSCCQSQSRCQSRWWRSRCDIAFLMPLPRCCSAALRSLAGLRCLHPVVCVRLRLRFR